MYTVIIYTFNRHDLLLRAIDYYQHFDCDVFIADSSDSKLSYKFPDNIIYKHFPKSAARHSEKIYETAKNITTPYVCLVPDDDYLLESSLKLASCFLDDNQDYVSAQGKYYKFELIENQVTFSPFYDLASTHYAVESKDRLSRLARAFNPFFHQIYSVHRADVFTKTWKFDYSVSKAGSYAEQAKKNFALDECLVQLVPMCHGKHKVLPILWMVRDYYRFDRTRHITEVDKKHESSNPISYYYKQLTARAKTTKIFLDSEDCQQLKKSFRDTISDLASNKESDALFDTAFQSFYKYNISSRNTILAKLIAKLLLPKWALQYYKKRIENQYSAGIDTVYENDFAKIRSSILNFQKCYDNFR
jgi:glycosyltransferase domain-containing protein